MIFAAKIGIIIGTSLVGGKTFGSLVNNSLGKVLATYAGLATGAYIGIKTANNLHHMIENAYETVKKEEDEEVKING